MPQTLQFKVFALVSLGETSAETDAMLSLTCLTLSLLYTLPGFQHADVLS